MEPASKPSSPYRHGWFHRAFRPLIVIFRQGTDPSRMAESVALGTFLGILPLPGLNAILCAVVAVRRGLNMGVIQGVNWLVFPLQIILFLPMGRLGARVFGHQPLPLGGDEIRALLKAGPVKFFKTIGLGFVDATIVWCAIGIPVCWALFRLVQHVLERRAGRRSRLSRNSQGR